MKFKYQARTKEGEIKTGIIEASSKESAIEILQNLGLYVTLLEEEVVPIFAREISLFPSISIKDVVVFTRQLSILLNSGVPLSDALSGISAQITNYTFRERILDITKQVESGVPFSSAISKHADIFSPFFVSMVKSGEIVGRLPFCLSRLADHLEREYNFKAKIQNAMRYPLLVLIVFLVVLLFLIFGLFPAFERLFKERNLEMPFFTKIIFGLSNFVRTNFLFLILIFIAIGIGLYLFLKSKEGKRRLDKFLLEFPLISPIFKDIYLSRFAESLATLVSGGIQSVTALETIKNLIGNSIYQDAIEKIKEELKRGVSLSRLLARYPKIFTPLFIQMVSVGERTGNLDLVLTNIAKFQEDELERKLEGILRLLEPTIILILAGGVAILVASVILPLYKLILTY